MWCVRKRKNYAVIFNYVKKKQKGVRQSYKGVFDKIYVISCGFKEFIDPVVADLGISADRVFANTFKFDSEGTIVGFDESNPLSQHNGKVRCLKESGIEGEIQIIGDGYSDFVMRKEGVAQTFFAYTENVSRKKATDNADYVVASIDEFLTINEL